MANLKQFLQVLKEQITKPIYYRVPLKEIDIESNKDFFINVLNSENNDTILPRDGRSIEENLSLIPQAREIYKMCVYKDGDEIREATTGLTITYRKETRKGFEVHLGESNAAFIDYEELIEVKEEIDEYTACMSKDLRAFNINQKMQEAKQSYYKMMSELQLIIARSIKR